MSTSESPSTKIAAGRPLLQWLTFVYTAVVWGMPIALCAAIWILLHQPWQKVLWIAFAPLVFALSFSLIAAILSRPHQCYPRTGRFEIDASIRDCFHHTLYSLCWSLFFHCRPVYLFVLSIRPLRNTIFRIFGYSGASNFSLSPDAWIYDLPCIDIGNGSHISAFASVAGSLVLAGREMLIDRVSIGNGALLGRFARVAPGTKLGDRCQIGAGAEIGLRAHIGHDSWIGPEGIVETSVHVGSGVTLGAGSLLGAQSQIDDGLWFPPGTFLEVNTRAERKQLYPKQESK